MTHWGRSEDFEVAFRLVQVHRKARNEARYAEQTYADVLHGLAKAGVEGESERLLVGIDVRCLHGQDGGLDLLIIGDLSFVHGARES